MIILIDNYDSFTYNIYHFVSKFNVKVEVYRNNKITIDKIIKLNPKGIIISPGPGHPKNSGITVGLIKKLYKKIPILGICLGHQAIGYAFGCNIVTSSEIMHGKISKIIHNNHKIFDGIDKNFFATRYHSLKINSIKFPKNLNIIAESENKIIMGIAHNKYKIFGIQFHPESIGTKNGIVIFKNFLNIINE
tara:strand:+ start:2118 stop:2690 length:573 start_codon:yes stop_codon:yes gene_type:complete